MMIARKKTAAQQKSSREMSIAELEAAAAMFEEEFAAEKTRQPTAQEKKAWQKAKKMGRPKIGAGAQVVSVSIEKGLLKEADRLAKRLRVSRANLISRGLEKLLHKKQA